VRREEEQSKMTMPEACCVCVGPPWLPMIPLHTGGLSRWYVCPRCGMIRQEMHRPGRGTANVIYHNLDDGRLSKAVIDEARAVLKRVRG
jgi:hypothetical protein